jgi:hypothetical protein
VVSLVGAAANVCCHHYPHHETQGPKGSFCLAARSHLRVFLCVLDRPLNIPGLRCKTRKQNWAGRTAPRKTKSKWLLWWQMLNNNFTNPVELLWITTSFFFLPFSFCMDTAPVSQRTHSYNPEIYPKESLLGKQTKNNPEGNCAGSKAVLWRWGRPRQLSRCF